MQPDKPGTKKKKTAKDRNDARLLLEASSLGLMFPIAIGLGFFAGWGFDKLVGTHPWGTGIGTACGVIAAFVNLFRLAAKE